MKRLTAVAVVAVALSALIAGPAFAHRGLSGIEIKESHGRVKAEGPGFRVTLTKDGVRTRIDEERFGIPEAGFPVESMVTDLEPFAPGLRPVECEHGTYRFVSGTFDVTERTSSTELRPPPYTPEFAESFPTIVTFVGIIDAVVENEEGEQFHLLATDLAHEVITPRRFTSTAPIHAFIVDSDGRVRDRASLTGRVFIDRRSGRSVHWIVDRGTCHQTADVDFGPGTDMATVFGPFFVLPFNTTVVRF